MSLAMRPNLSVIDVQYRHQVKERFSIIKNNITELVFILDRSGSMAGLESDTIGGFNSMVEKQEKQDVYIVNVNEKVSQALMNF